MQERRRPETVDDLFNNLKEQGRTLSFEDKADESTAELNPSLDLPAIEQGQRGNFGASAPLADIEEPGVAEKAQKNFQIGFDLSLVKIATVIVLFLVVFALPIGVYNYWMGVRSNTNQAINLQNGTARVAGASTTAAVTQNASQSGNSQTTAGSVSPQSNLSSIPNLLGVPLNQILLILGGIFLILPLFILKGSKS